MTKIILCEGATDAILISYYLITVNGWRAKDNKANRFVPPFKIPYDDTQRLYWYNRGDDVLAIFAVGGVDRFRSALSEILMINKGLGNHWADRLVIISDRDHATSETEVIQTLQDEFAAHEIVAVLENNAWATVEQVSEFEEEMQIDVACLVVPFDREGAIETFMLDSLSEQQEEQLVVSHARNAVTTLNSEKYLLKPRERIKAELGTSFALMFPEKVFSLIDELIQSIPWEEYKKVREEFALLDTL